MLYTQMSAIVAEHGVPWTSEEIPVRPFEYYRLHFQSRTDQDAYWWGIFLNADGEPMVADHVSGVYASEEWSDNDFCFMAKADACRVKLRFSTIGEAPEHVRDVRLAGATGAEVARWADSVYAGMPPLDYEPAADRLRLLPRTINRLCRGPVLKIVMLGDSVINDAGNSPYGALLERTYPATRVPVVTSVLSGGGCPRFKQDGRVKPFVLDYQPDLVMIGGISNGGDVESVREVVRQIRAASKAEVMVMTPAPPVGPDPRDGRPPSPAAARTGEDYRRRLREMARGENVEFLEMTEPWIGYVMKMRQPYSFLMRDSHHVNARGREVIARIFEKHFAPFS